MTRPVTAPVLSVVDDGSTDGSLDFARRWADRDVRVEDGPRGPALARNRAADFWAGCGAVRADAFADVGGFDAEAFPRPQIEDIELGYRLRDAGHRIEIRPEVQAKHLKRWTFRGIVRTDLLDRGIPWVRLLLNRDSGNQARGTLNVGRLEKVKTGLVGLALLMAGIAVFTADARWAAGSVGLLAGVILLNAPAYRWFAERRGWLFALRAIPFHLLYHLVSGLAVVVGGIGHGVGLDRPRSRKETAPLHER